MAPPRARGQRGSGGGGPTALAVIWGLGVTELLIILGVLILLFGARRIPEIARGIGAGIRNFKGEMKEGEKPEDRTLPGERGGPRD